MEDVRDKIAKGLPHDANLGKWDVENHDVEKVSLKGCVDQCCKRKHWRSMHLIKNKVCASGRELTRRNGVIMAIL